MVNRRAAHNAARRPHLLTAVARYETSQTTSAMEQLAVNRARLVRAADRRLARITARAAIRAERKASREKRAEAVARKRAAELHRREHRRASYLKQWSIREKVVRRKEADVHGRATALKAIKASKAQKSQKA